MVKKKIFSGVGKASFENQQQNQHIQSLAKNIAILTGQTKNKDDRAVLYSDLVELGVLNKSGALLVGGGNTTTVIGGGGGGGAVDATIETPHAPVNVRASGAFSTVLIQWDTPTYKGHLHAEIWRNTVDQLGDMLDPQNAGEATLVATVGGDLFVDSVNYDTEYWYWVRFVNRNDPPDYGAVQSANGIYVKTNKSVSDQIADLQAQVDADLNGWVESFDASIDALNAANAALDTRIIAVEAEADDLLNQITVAETNISNAITRIDAVELQADTIETNFDNLSANFNSASLQLDELELRVDLDASQYTSRFADMDLLTEGLLQAVVNIEVANDNEISRISYQAQRTDDAEAQILQESITRATETEAISQQYQILDSQVNDPATGLEATRATLVNDYYTAATIDSSIASDITILQTQVNDPVTGLEATRSTLINEYYTASTIDSTIASDITTLQSQVNDPTTGLAATRSTLINEYYTAATIDSTVASDITTLQSQVNDPSTGLAATRATLQNEYYTAATIDSGIAQNLTTLQTQVNDPNTGLAATRATLINDYYTASEIDSTVAQSILTLDAQVNDLTTGLPATRATLINDYYTKADTDSAIAGQISTYNAQITDPSTGTVAMRATLVQDYYTKVDADSAISAAIDTYNAEVTDPVTGTIATRALLNSQHYTQAQTDVAISQSIDAYDSQIFDPTTGTAVARATLATTHYTRTETDSAISAQLDVFESEITDPVTGSVATRAELISNYYTKTDADSATSAALNVFLTDVTDPETGTLSTRTQIASEYYNKSTIDQGIAQQLNNLQTSVFDPTGDGLTALASSMVSKMDQAIANVDGSAISQSVGQWTVNYNGTDYSISSVTSIAVDVDGAYTAQWGVRTNASTPSGLQHGIGLWDNGTKTTFAVSTDNFVVFNPLNEGEFEQVFTVVDGKVVAKEAIIEYAQIDTLLVENKAIFESGILSNSTITAPAIQGGSISGSSLTAIHSGYAVSIEPSHAVPFFFGGSTFIDPQGATRITGNALFCLTSTGRAVMRGAEIYDNAGNLLLSSGAGLASSQVTNIVDDNYIQTAANSTYIRSLITGDLKGDVLERGIIANPINLDGASQPSYYYQGATYRDCTKVARITNPLAIARKVSISPFQIHIDNSDGERWVEVEFRLMKFSAPSWITESTRVIRYYTQPGQSDAFISSGVLTGDLGAGLTSDFKLQCRVQVTGSWKGTGSSGNVKWLPIDQYATFDSYIVDGSLIQEV